MSRPDPFSSREVEVLREYRDELLALDDVVGSWETKLDARQTGFSLHIKFENKVGVSTAIRMAAIFEQSSTKLCQLASRVLDQIEAAETAESSVATGEEP